LKAPRRAEALWKIVAAIPSTLKSPSTALLLGAAEAHVHLGFLYANACLGSLETADPVEAAKHFQAAHDILVSALLSHYLSLDQSLSYHSHLSLTFCLCLSFFCCRRTFERILIPTPASFHHSSSPAAFSSSKPTSLLFKRALL